MGTAAPGRLHVAFRDAMRWGAMRCMRACRHRRGNTSVVVRVVREAREDGEGGGGGGGERGPNSGESRETAGDAWSKGAAGRRERPQVQHLQIDTGKTWREGVIRWFPRSVREGGRGTGEGGAERVKVLRRPL